jgi:hypothetical protein
VGRLRIKKRENDLCWFGTLLFGGFGMLGTTKFSRMSSKTPWKLLRILRCCLRDGVLID